jgi:hypothetical protein
MSKRKGNYNTEDVANKLVKFTKAEKLTKKDFEESKKHVFDTIGKMDNGVLTKFMDELIRVEKGQKKKEKNDVQEDAIDVVLAKWKKKLFKEKDVQFTTDDLIPFKVPKIVSSGFCSYSFPSSPISTQNSGIPIFPRIVCSSLSLVIGQLVIGWRFGLTKLLTNN